MATFDQMIGVRTLWQEARGEPPAGRQGVAHAIVNRRKSGRWGETYGEVCFSEYEGIYQFSGWARNDPNRAPAFRLADDDPLLLELTALFLLAETEADPTDGALFYYAASMKSAPSWAGTMRFCGRFGAQLFYSDRAGVPV